MILGLSLKPPRESISNFNKLKILAQWGSILETQLNSTCPELGTAQPQLVLTILTHKNVFQMYYLEMNEIWSK